MIHVLPTRETNGKHVKSSRATVIILDSKKTLRRHAVTEEEWTKLMPNRDISEELTDSTSSANGRICIIQNGPQENCCIYIHTRQLWFTGCTTELGRKTEFCELVPSCMKEKHNPYTRFERRSLVYTVRIFLSFFFKSHKHTTAIQIERFHYN